MMNVEKLAEFIMNIDKGQSINAFISVFTKTCTNKGEKSQDESCVESEFNQRRVG